MIVKVCGVRSAEIADVAVTSGADWIGVVLEPRSVRHADDSAVRAVVDAVRDRADVIGVLVDADAATCNDAASRYRLSAVQVHGRASTALLAEVEVPVIRGINVGSEHQALTVDWPGDCLVLLDHAPESRDALPGGTGRSLPLPWAEEAARHRRIILAGGLDAGNVTEAVRRVQPEGVDASSGLESAPGIKDAQRVIDYVTSARAASAAQEVA